MDPTQSPIIQGKDYDADSVFEPENLLREARRQKRVPEGRVPRICILDPDGDMVEHLVSSGIAKINPYWACYHTKLYDFENEGIEFGIIGCAVGASFAVLLAEQLFVSGCELLISITSSGVIVPKGSPPYFVLIEKALRDEGTSYHYLPPSEFAYLDDKLSRQLHEELLDLPVTVHAGATWTTDAPFRETEAAIGFAKSKDLLAVEMEAAALYAFAAIRRKPVICFAHVTNQMGNIEGDFEKGEANGCKNSLIVISGTARAWLSKQH